MARITEQRLQGLALRVLESAIAEASENPANQSLGLRLALAYLASLSDCDRAPFDQFWRALALRNDTSRTVELQEAKLRIHLQLGVIDIREYSAQIVGLPVRTKKGWR